MINISVKGLADFMTASAARQRSVLRDFKYPSLDDARAKIHYYREARDTVILYHKGKHDATWLTARVAELIGRSTSSTPGAQKRLRNNARVLRAYGTYFGTKEYEVLPRLNWKLQHSGVEISIQPDLHVSEKGKEKIIKLEFSVEAPDARTPRIVGQCMFEAARIAGLTVPSSSVLFADVTRGQVHKGARLGAYMRRDIHAACDTITDIWPKI